METGGPRGPPVFPRCLKLEALVLRPKSTGTTRRMRATVFIARISTMKAPARLYAAVVTLALAMFWIGLLVGVSFLATPAKFLASNLPLPVALDIGRHTFGIFNKTEWLLALGMVVLTLGCGDRTTILAGIGAGLAVSFETFWLLPILDRRVALIIAGQSPSATEHHSIYLGVEIAKLAILAVIAARAAIRIRRSLGRGPQADDGCGLDKYYILDV